MRARLSQKLLPLTLCFAVGVALNAAGGFVWSALRGGGPSARAEAHSRTWLVIKSRPRPFSPFVAGGDEQLLSAWFRVRFEADGTVSKLLDLPQLTPPAPWQAVDEAVETLKFKPPTEDGRPLAVTADVMHEWAVKCEETPSPGSWLGGNCVSRPFGMSVHIISVEGAKNAEGWRVVYE